MEKITSTEHTPSTAAAAEIDDRRQYIVTIKRTVSAWDTILVSADNRMEAITKASERFEFCADNSVIEDERAEVTELPTVASGKPKHGGA